jgi:iron complex outermembrane receptor protein
MLSQCKLVSIPSRSTLTLLAVSLVGGGAVPQLSLAQAVLEEVIVTARKREESLTESPVAVSALSGAMLEDIGVRDLSDLRKVVPNIDVYGGNGTGGSGNVYIRGVGARNTGVNFDSGVGIYVDGVYISRPDGALLDNTDIQSVQVLRGPQGTLFGKNTTGGAVLYTMNKPVDEFEGMAQVNVGNYNRRDGKFVVNVPLVEDALYSRLALSAVTRDGYVENLVDGDQYTDENRLSGMFQLRWDAGDSVMVDFNISGSRTDQKARGQKCLTAQGVPGAGWQSSAQDDPIIIPSTGQSILEHCIDAESLDIDEVLNDLPQNNYQVDVWAGAATVDWEINQNLNLKSISAYRSTTAGQGADLDSLAIPLLHRSNFESPIDEDRVSDQFSQEFQFTGTAFNSAVNYVVGVFGFQEKSTAGIENGRTGPFFGFLGNPQWANFTNNATELFTDNRSASVFSQADWNFADSWRLTLGLRYTWESRELERNVYVPVVSSLTLPGSAQATPLAIPGGFLEFPDGAASYNPGHSHVISTAEGGQQTEKISDSKWTPMGSIQYLFEDAGAIDTGSAYFTVSQGFLSGGLSESLDLITGLIPEYAPELVTNFELGFKMDGFGRKLRFNTALFHMLYKDRQLTSVRLNPDTGQISGTTINAAKSTISGLELETMYIPVAHLELSFNAAFNRGEIQEFDDIRLVVPGSLPGNCASITSPAVDACPVDRSDEDLPRLPTQTYYLAAQYSWITDIGRIIPRLQYSLRKDVDNCFDRASCLVGIYKGDQKDLSARLSWLSNRENWRVTLWGANLTDDRYIEGGTPLVDVTETAGVVYNMPRSYGLEASFNW